MSSLSENEVIDNEKINAITKIIQTIRIENDYAKAATILQDTGMSLYELSCMTLRLSTIDIARLGDELVKI